jgi:uncharacterized protein (TIGR02145 family)
MVSVKHIFKIVSFILLMSYLCISCKKDELPREAKAETRSVSEIKATTARASGEIIDLGKGINDFGHCWSLTVNPTVSGSKTSFGSVNQIGVFTSDLTNLEPSRVYHIKAYVISGSDIFYGSEQVFTTKDGVYDMDGNIYNMVTIGSQTWIAENLKTTRLNDGTLIPLTQSESEWSTLASSGYCWYNNDITNKTVYGALYNWYTVNTGKLCPSGWHVPTDSEWSILTDFLGGLGYAGGKLKEAGTVHWNFPNEGATNESNFTALPGGSRNLAGQFCCMGNGGAWWSSTEYSPQDAYVRDLGYSYSDVKRGNFEKNYGISVRCIKN